MISSVQMLDIMEETGDNDETGEDDKIGEIEKCVLGGGASILNQRV